MIAGGLEPTLRHSMMAAREIEKGSVGSTMLTFNGNTESKKEIKNQKYNIEKNLKGHVTHI
jgi:hypothetical protein